MAIVVDDTVMSGVAPVSSAAASSAPTHSLLLTLRAIQRLQQTRTALSHELDAQYTSFLSQTPSPLDDLLLDPTAATASTAGLTPCQLESIRPPNEVEMGEILRISFVGLMEVKNEMEEHIELLRTVWERKDLVQVVQNVEKAEGEKLKVSARMSCCLTIERDTLLRLAELEDGDFDRAIVDANKKRADLAIVVSENMDEISAEIAELLAAEPT